MSYSDNSRGPRDESYGEEGPGHITNDSLAAESLRSGGDFAGNSDRDVQPNSVSSRSTTANVTDDSSSTVLPSARDKTERLSERESYDPTESTSGYEGAYSNRSGGRDNDNDNTSSSRGGRDNDNESSSYSRGGGRDNDNESSSYSRGGGGNDNESSSYSRGGGGNDNESSSYSRGGSGNDNESSSYSRGGGGNDNDNESSSYSRGGGRDNDNDSSSYGRQAGGSSGRDDETPSYQPKGRNLQEGGFDDSAPNASFNSMNDEPGSKNDPGRYGLRKAEEENARDARDSGYEGSGNPRDTNEQSGFDRLRREEDA